MRFLSNLWRHLASFGASLCASSRASLRTPSPRVQSLESELSRAHHEISRLRAENRALLNSILGIAGMKPLPLALDTSFHTPPAIAGHSESSPPSIAADRPLSTPTASSSPADVASAPPLRQSEARNGSSPSALASTPRQLRAPAHRRRSWHQINRLLELQSTKKEVASE